MGLGAAGHRLPEQPAGRGSSVQGRTPENALDDRPSTFDTNDVVWTIGLQDKAWGGYTLVVTYDFQFDPKGSKLGAGGIHALDVERETGSVAVTTAANLKVSAVTVAEPLRRVDESELAASDRALVTRSVLLAYQYTGDHYDLGIEVRRFDEAPVLSAVASWLGPTNRPTR